MESLVVSALFPRQASSCSAFWVAIGFQGDGPTEQPGVWGVSVDDDPGPNVLKRMFHKPDGAAFTRLRDRVWQVLREDPRIRIVPEDELP